MNDILAIILALVLTLIIETSFFLIVGYRDKKFIITCLIINIISNLALNISLYLVKNYTDFNYLFALIIGEVSVFILEALTYFFVYKKDYALIFFTLSANALSLLLGFIIFYIISKFI